MTTYSNPVINGVTLPPISDYKETFGLLGSSSILANGSLRRDLLTNYKCRKFYLAWTKLSGDEKATIETAFEYVMKNIASYTSPTGEAYDVTVDDVAEDIEFTAFMSAGQMYFRTSFTLRQVPEGDE